MFVCIGEGSGTISLTFSNGWNNSGQRPTGERLTAEIAVQ